MSVRHGPRDLPLTDSPEKEHYPQRREAADRVRRPLQDNGPRPHPKSTSPIPHGTHTTIIHSAERAVDDSSSPKVDLAAKPGRKSYQREVRVLFEGL
ncbi:MAG: hypothetical protein M1816_005231 [Peltula sp. TS41687]|nr:MAG: hypothetical protein M1816_005231 [Peltula sp. TS41687]